MNNSDIKKAMKISLEDIFEDLPSYPVFNQAIRRAPKREFTLSEARKIAEMFD
jgi:urocanate hydratase